MSAVFIPFSYFFTEASFIEDEDYPIKKKILNALKYTAAPVIIICILLFVGLFLHTNHIEDKEELSTPNEEKLIFHSNYYGRKLLQSSNETYQTLDTQSIYYDNDSISENSPSSYEMVVDENTAIAYSYLDQLLDSNCKFYYLIIIVSLFYCNLADYEPIFKYIN